MRKRMADRRHRAQSAQAPPPPADRLSGHTPMISSPWARGPRSQPHTSPICVPRSPNLPPRGFVRQAGICGLPAVRNARSCMIWRRVGLGQVGQDARQTWGRPAARWPDRFTFLLGGTTVSGSSPMTGIPVSRAPVPGSGQPPRRGSHRRLRAHLSAPGRARVSVCCSVQPSLGSSPRHGAGSVHRYSPW
jgi:hypothetical protein